MAEHDLKKYDEAFLRHLLEQMLLIRRFEERSSQAYGLRKIRGFFHPYVGQEACAVGAIAALDLAKDYVLTAYRDHGHALAVGMDPKTIMAELFAKAPGCSRAKGGSMHLFDANRHFLGGNGIVGAHLPVATGVALKIRYLDETGVVLCFFGDGAIHQGTFHESLNMARIWNLPIIYICENNHYGMGTAFERVSAVTNLAQLACAYDVPGQQVDGMDVIAMHEAVHQALQRARNERTPTLLEALTYRYMGHSMSDPATYRTKEEMEKYRAQDPLIIYLAMLKEAGLANDEQWHEMDERVKTHVEQAIEFAENAPEPAMQTLWEDVYV